MIAGQVSVDDDMLKRIEGEYLEMPGLQLTCEQAQRLWHIDRAECEALLGTLVAAGFLTRTPAGNFAMIATARAHTPAQRRR
jgi:hypothetical protein